MTRPPDLPLAFRRLLNGFWAIAGAVSVRTKILGIVLALMLILGGSVTLQVRTTLRDALSHELQSRGVSIARDVAAHSVDLLLVHDLYRVHQLLRDTLANNPDVRYAFIVSPEGDILTHTFEDGFPTALLAVNTVLPDERYHLQRVETREGIIWDFAVPVFDGLAGTARIGLTEQAMQATLDSVTGQLLLTTVLVSAIGVIAAIFLTWIITRPVLDLVEVTRAVARGDLSQKAPHWADDEIGRLSDAFNVMISDLATARLESEAYNAELLRRNQELARLNQIVQEKEAARGQLLEKIITAQEEERKRIARELHDDTSQALTSLKVGLKVLEGLPSPEQAHQHLAGLREIISQTLEAVHDLALELRPSVLDDMGLVAALNRYIDEYQRRFALQVDCRAIGFEGRRLPPVVETALYRIVQEALTNVARHAGASHASVLLEWTWQHIRAIIEDNGRGFEPARDNQERSLGLYGMQERANLIGGELRIETQPGVGTTVVVHIPVSVVPTLPQPVDRITPPVEVPEC